MRRKYPIISGIFILVAVFTIFFLLVYALTFISNEQKSFSISERVGIVAVEGFIGDSNDIVEQLNHFENDNSIKAVVIRINSPGGSVAPSQEIFEAVTQIKKKKKVIVSMGSVAASGGYMIACAADKIVANPGTITGSIAAVMHFANAEELMKKVGLKASVIKSGRYKDIGSPTRIMTTDEKQLIQGLVDDIYDQFLEVVSKNRKIPKDQLRNIADGRVFSGRQALRLGLIDEMGDLNRAIKIAGELSGISGKPEIVRPRDKRLTLWDYILGNVISSLDGKINEGKVGLTGVHYLCMPLMYQAEILSGKPLLRIAQYLSDFYVTSQSLSGAAKSLN